jgi:hypothetical protein
VRKVSLRLSIITRRRENVDSLLLKISEHKKVLVPFSSALPRFSELESFEILRKLLRSKRL